MSNQLQAMWISALLLVPIGSAYCQAQDSQAARKLFWTEVPPALYTSVEQGYKLVAAKHQLSAGDKEKVTQILRDTPLRSRQQKDPNAPDRFAESRKQARKLVAMGPGVVVELGHLLDESQDDDLREKAIQSLQLWMFHSQKEAAQLCSQILVPILSRTALDRSANVRLLAVGALGDIALQLEPRGIPTALSDALLWVVDNDPDANVRRVTRRLCVDLHLLPPISGEIQWF